MITIATAGAGGNVALVGYVLAAVLIVVWDGLRVFRETPAAAKAMTGRRHAVAVTHAALSLALTTLFVVGGVFLLLTAVSQPG